MDIITENRLRPLRDTRRIWPLRAMKVLVAFATKAGSTKGIAEFLGERLRSQGMQVDVEDVRSVKNPGDYDAYVIGSAVYMFHWMGEAKQFVLKNRALFIHKPVWLFSSGPVGFKATNEKGQDLTDVAVSGPKEIEELLEAASPRDHRVFFGAVYA